MKLIFYRDRSLQGKEENGGFLRSIGMANYDVVGEKALFEHQLKARGIVSASSNLTQYTSLVLGPERIGDINIGHLRGRYCCALGLALSLRACHIGVNIQQASMQSSSTRVSVPLMIVGPDLHFWRVVAA